MSSKEEERRRRQAEIAALTAELTTTTPTYTKFEPPPVEEDNRSDDVEDDATVVELSYSASNLIGHSGGLFENISLDTKKNHGDPTSLVLNATVNPDKRHDKHSVNHSEPNAHAILSLEEELDAFALSRKIPVSHSVDLGKHSKAVSCFSTDPSGNRVVTGSLDYNIKIFDFGGMDTRHVAFKSFEGLSGHIVSSVAHSMNGDRFAIACGSPQARIFDRDGNFMVQFTKGDMYIRDLSHTKVNKSLP